VDGKDDGAGVVAGLDVLQLGGEEVELVVGNRGPLFFAVGIGLAGDDAGIFERVAEESDDADVGSVEREVDAGLGHGSAMEGSGFLRDYDRLVAEVASKGSERLAALGRVGHDEGVVIARDGKDGCGIVAEGFVELVVVVEGLSEVVDDVAEVKEKRGATGGGGSVKVAGDGVGDFDHGGESPCGGGAAVADHVKVDGLGRLDRLDDFRSVRSPGGGEGENIAGLVGGWIEGDDIFDEELLQFTRVEFVVGNGRFELCGIGGGDSLVEDWLTEERLLEFGAFASWHGGCLPFIFRSGAWPVTAGPLKIWKSAALGSPAVQFVTILFGIAREKLSASVGRLQGTTRRAGKGVGTLLRDLDLCNGKKTGVIIGEGLLTAKDAKKGRQDR